MYGENKHAQQPPKNVSPFASLSLHLDPAPAHLNACGKLHGMHRVWQAALPATSRAALPDLSFAALSAQFFFLMWEAVQDPIILLLIAAALVSLNLRDSATVANGRRVPMPRRLLSHFGAVPGTFAGIHHSRFSHSRGAREEALD